MRPGFFGSSSAAAPRRPPGSVATPAGPLSPVIVLVYLLGCGTGFNEAYPLIESCHPAPHSISGRNSESMGQDASL